MNRKSPPKKTESYGIGMVSRSETIELRSCRKGDNGVAAVVGNNGCCLAWVLAVGWIKEQVVAGLRIVLMSNGRVADNSRAV